MLVWAYEFLTRCHPLCCRMGTKYTFNIDVDFIQQVCKNSVKSTLGVGQCTIGLGAVLSPAIVRHESADQAFWNSSLWLRLHNVC